MVWAIWPHPPHWGCGNSVAKRHGPGLTTRWHGPLLSRVIWPPTKTHKATDMGSYNPVYNWIRGLVCSCWSKETILPQSQFQIQTAEAQLSQKTSSITMDVSSPEHFHTIKIMDVHVNDMWHYGWEAWCLILPLFLVRITILSTILRNQQWNL